jgi:hypothetical protein
MAREQKGKHKASQNSGKRTDQSSQPKKQQQETVVVIPQQQPETVVAPQQQPEVVIPQQQQDSTIAPVAPTWPAWPTSKPGPRSTPPPPGMHSFNVFRPEQFGEVGYNQETGEPGLHSSLPDASMKDQVSFDQQAAGLNTLSKRKKRL